MKPAVGITAASGHATKTGRKLIATAKHADDGYRETPQSASGDGDERDDGFEEY